MFLHQIVGDGVEVQDRVAYRCLVTDAQHPQVYLLGKVCGIGLAADAALKECLQGTAVLGEQAFDQGWLGVRRRHDKGSSLRI